MTETNIWNVTVDSYVPSVTGIDSFDSSSHYCGYWCNHSTKYNYWTYTTPATIYMYQIKCPSCNKMNWAQLETTVECKTAKCKAKLRAVTAKPEHIIEVEV